MTRTISLKWTGFAQVCIAPECYIKMARVTKLQYMCNQCQKTMTPCEVASRLIFELKTLNRNIKLSSYSISKYSGGLISASAINFTGGRVI